MHFRIVRRRRILITDGTVRNVAIRGDPRPILPYDERRGVRARYSRTAYTVPRRPVSCYRGYPVRYRTPPLILSRFHRSPARATSAWSVVPGGAVGGMSRCETQRDPSLWNSPGRPLATPVSAPTQDGLTRRLHRSRPSVTQGRVDATDHTQSAQISITCERPSSVVCRRESRAEIAAEIIGDRAEIVACRRKSCVGDSRCGRCGQTA